MSDMSRNIEGKEAEEILDSILADYELDRTIDKMEDFYDQPNKEVIIDIISFSSPALRLYPEQHRFSQQRCGSGGRTA